MSHLSFPITSFYSESIYRLAEPSESSGSGVSGSWEQLTASVVNDSIIVTVPGVYEITPEGGADDDIATIIGGDVGDEIILQTDGSAELTIKHGVNNIQIGYDFLLSNINDQIRLRKRDATTWVGASGLATNA